MSPRGMTLIELMIGAAILVGGGGAILVSMNYAMIHSDYLTDYQVAMDAVQSRLDEMTANASADFVSVASGVTYPRAVSSTGACRGLREDTNCNNVLDVGEDLNGNGQLDEPIPGARLNIMITEPDGSAPDGNSTLLDLHVAACWTARGNAPTRRRRRTRFIGGRVIGEDQNCNGFLDRREDANRNNWLDSPAMAHMRISLGDP